MKRRKIHFAGISGFQIPWERQIPGGGNTWGESEYVDQWGPDDVPDWLLVCDAWRDGPFVTRVPKERRILLCGEPESFHRYQPRFLAQFGHVLSTQRGTGHPGVIHIQPAISWFVGVRFGWEGVPNEYPLKFEDFEAGNPPKTKLCSVVCSTKAVSKGHRKRLAFVERLKHELGDQIDIYGRGFRDVRDKDEALADYRFHIAIENSSHPDYWTEKLADPLLRGCFPIYAGCPNLEDYFPPGSYARIDIDRPEHAIRTIRAILQSQLDHEQATALGEAKRRVLWEHNMLPMMERIYPILEQGLSAPRLLDVAELLKTDHECKDLKWSRKVRHVLRNWFAR